MANEYGAIISPMKGRRGNRDNSTEDCCKYHGECKKEILRKMETKRSPILTLKKRLNGNEIRQRTNESERVRFDSIANSGSCRKK